MLLSRACEYGIRAMVYIMANSGEDEKVGLRDICTAINAPQHYTAKILQSLSKKGLISSARGRSGGFSMNSERSPLSLLDIVIAIDGDDILQHCVLQGTRCNGENPCILHPYYVSIREEIRSMLENCRITEHQQAKRKD